MENLAGADSGYSMDVPDRSGTTQDLFGEFVVPEPQLSTARPASGWTAPTGPSSKQSWYRRYRRRAVVVDMSVALVAGLLCTFAPLGDAPLQARVMTALALPGAWYISLLLAHGYERRYLGITPDEYRAIGRAVVGLLISVAVASWLSHLEIARGMVLGAAPVLLVLNLMGRHVLRRGLIARREAGADTQRTVVIGNVATVAPLIRQLRRAPGEGMHVVGACVSGLATDGDFATAVEGVPVFGYPDEAMHAIDLLDAEVVAVSSDPELSGPSLRRLAWSLEEREVDLVIAPGLFEVAGPRLSIRPSAGMPLLHVERPAMSGARRLFKRSADIILATGLMCLAAPVLLAIAVAVRLDSPGNVLFRQTRVGARGETFQMLKFRTMCVDAEQRKAQLVGSVDAGNAVLFKMRRDPRVTKVGGILRRFSIDELPQLVNVVRGEMSLVGPRPSLPSEVAAYESDATRRLRVTPGLTGLWQVSGRSDLSWEESLRLDLWYVDNWSLLLDLHIMARTARAVLGGSGAY
ncbi:sugar transferase [Pedococcus sp. KACC 23699]|uniref:Sugar transferase n=1 Tax=Pedococcus sp. KACC 23699 TaxID=3149228 RepID=A0AAU7JW97_9MICO